MQQPLLIRKLILISIFIFFGFHFSFAQISGGEIGGGINNPEPNDPQAEAVAYTYDAAGNRLTRRIIYLRTIQTSFGEDTTLVSFSPPAESPQVMIDELDRREIRIYPNPTQGQLKVEFMGTYTSSETQIIVVSSEGIPVVNTPMTTNPMPIDLSGRTDGVYFLTIRERTTQTTWTIIKQ